MIEMNKCIYVYIVFDLVVDEESTEVEKLKIERLEVFFKCFYRFCKFGKVRKTEETLANFSEKSKCLKRKEKIYIYILHFASALFSKDMLRIEKGVRSMDFI